MSLGSYFIDLVSKVANAWIGTHYLWSNKQMCLVIADNSTRFLNMVSNGDPANPSTETIICLKTTLDISGAFYNDQVDAAATQAVSLYGTRGRNIGYVVGGFASVWEGNIPTPSFQPGLYQVGATTLPTEIPALSERPEPDGPENVYQEFATHIMGGERIQYKFAFENGATPGPINFQGCINIGWQILGTNELPDVAWQLNSVVVNQGQYIPGAEPATITTGGTTQGLNQLVAVASAYCTYFCASDMKKLEPRETALGQGSADWNWVGSWTYPSAGVAPCEVTFIKPPMIPIAVPGGQM